MSFSREKAAELYEAAAELEGDRREAYLEEACRGEPALLREVLSLLSYAERAKAVEFMAAPALGHSLRLMADGGEADDELSGGIVGGYKILRLLGEGGMGAVYLAEDVALGRRVALKVVRSGLKRREFLRRFGEEQKILAGLRHPNIAALYEAGADEGRPFFVMEYVEGVPADEYVAARGLSTEARLRLFRTVCSAVSYAHQNLVVHRDIKPSNILVAEDPETREATPKLLDFGIAKLLTPGGPVGGATATAARALTPEYASPEQIRGEKITTATDVYSLGVLLYELLAGRHPHDLEGRRPDEVARAICEEEPARPSTVVGRAKGAGGDAERLRRRLRGDLDNIVLKALRKDPSRRYASVGQLSDDIRRHLEGLPVSARKDTLGYRAGKFVRRNKVGVIAASLVFVTLSAGIVAVGWEARQARRRFDDVRELAHSILFDYHDAIADLPGSTPVRERLVGDALRYLDNLSREGGGDASLRREMAAAYQKVGDVQGRPNFANLGHTDGALESYRKALVLREALAAASPEDAGLRLELAETYGRISDVLRQLGNLNGAVDNNRKAVEILRGLAASNPSDVKVRETLAQAYTTLGDVQGNPNTLTLGDKAGALEDYRQALAIREQLVAEDPNDFEKRKWLTVSHQRLGNMLQEMNDGAGALEHYGQAVAIDEALLRSDPTNTFVRRDLAISHTIIAITLSSQKDFQGALRHQAETIRLREQLVKDDPKNVSLRVELGGDYSRMGGYLTSSKDAAGARTYFTKAQKVLEEAVAQDPKNVNYLTYLRGNFMRAADLLVETGDLAGAVESTRGALATNESIAAFGGKGNPQVRRYAALLYAQLGREYGLLASDAHAPQDARRQKAHEACDWYGKSLRDWQEVRDETSLTNADVVKFQEVEREMAKCAAASGS